MVTKTDTNLAPLVVNELTKTQYNAAAEIPTNEMMLVDPEFAGSKALVTDENGNITESSITSTELGSLSGVVDNIQEQINNLKSRGRYLSQWNCATGLAVTTPQELPYDYKTGDYFVIGNVGTGTKYKPNGAQYTGVASTTVETENVSVDDVYYYDGTTWHLQINTQKTVSFGQISGNPNDNTQLASALSGKYPTTNPAGYISGITQNMVLNALGYTPYNSTNPSGYISGITGAMVTTALGYTPYNATNPNNYISRSGISATSPIAYNSTTGVVSVASGYQIPTTTQITTFTNKQDAITDLATIRTNAQDGKSASNTIATYGNIVTHNASEFATAAQGAKADAAVQNTATGTGSLTILGDVSNASYSINIGDSSSTGGFLSVSIGYYAKTNSQKAVSLGSNSMAWANNSTAIGSGAQAMAIGAIQLGGGTNSEAGSMCVGLTTNGTTLNNYKLLGSDGNIPPERLTNALPPQTGQSGKFLTTNGTSASWAVPKTFSLLDFKWSDYELNDQNWLRSDTFSWQSGTVYSQAYNHLVADLTTATSSIETVGSYSLTVYTATDGHKIVLDDEASTVANIFTESGVAWYYIVDTTNTRFKLPRTKYGFNGLRDSVGNYISESLPDHIHTSLVASDRNGNPNGAGDSGNNRFYWRYSTTYYNTTPASNNNSVYKNGAPVQQRATQMYLYFYVGQFSQTATEQTASLNLELFNGKMDSAQNIQGYSSSGTLVLKCVNGSLRWVQE